MSKTCSDQLGLFDSSSLGWGFDLGVNGAAGDSRFRETSDDDGDDSERAAPPPAAVVPRIPAVTLRLTGDRALAANWKGRAADTIAAIRLAREIEDAARPATADEQVRLAKFTGFGASDLANSFFRRPGESFRPGWEEMGHELERLLSAEEMAALSRSTQYAHFTPEFMIRAIWRAVTRMANGLLLRDRDGRVGEVEWRRLEHKPTGRLLVGFGHAMTIDAAQGITSDEHINALPRGTAGMTGFTAYVAESRARGTTWTLISDEATFDAVRSRRALGDLTPTTAEDMWT